MNINSHQKNQSLDFFCTPGNEIKFMFPYLPFSLFLVQTFLCGDSRSDQRHLAKNERQLEGGKKQQLVLLFVENARSIYGLMGTGTEDQLRHKYHTS